MFRIAVPSRETQMRLLRFLAVGGTAAGVQFSVLAALREVFSANLAFTAAFLFGTATHYGLNRFWALPSNRGDSLRQFVEYIATAGISYLVNIGLFVLCRAVFGLTTIWAALVAVPPATIVVFLLLNYRVFRH